MLQLSILASATNFAREFERCCRQYEELHFAAAWCGNPNVVLPYEHLQMVRGPVSAIIGRSFDQTHPDAFEFLLTRGVDLRVFRKEKGLFHPKLYLFCSGKKIAVFIGSSNLTYSGFYSNFEANVLLEGIPESAETKQIEDLRTQLATWSSESYSFVPDQRWIETYRKEFSKGFQIEKHGRLSTPRQYENDISRTSWLANATWETYYKRILQGLKQNNHDASEYDEVLEKARETLQIPWKPEYFNDPEARRIIGGMKPYGALGHVAASGQFRHLLANGTSKQRQVIADVVNEIASLKLPIDWYRVGILLERLVQLGPTMKVWSRVLCLVRPDLFCTVSSMFVRANLSQTLKVSQSSFESSTGYMGLMKLIHAAPWMQSSRPNGDEELHVWKRRVAFMDAIFYSE